MSTPFVLLLAVTVLAGGCATLKQDETKNKLTLNETSAEDLKPVSFKSSNGFAAYDYSDRSYQAEWIDCRVEKPAATILVMHRDKAGYDTKSFCQGWVAQSFLSQNFDVITVNRPGFGGSTGTADFAGAQSVAAIDAGVKEALKTAKNPHEVSGVWGYSSGATAAAFYAKKNPQLTFLILGGGLYDLEDSLKNTQDSYLKKEIESLKKTGGVQAIEDRSIAFDPSGLPKKITIYHGKLDKAVLPQQAENFRDALVSNGEYKVTFQVIDGVSHDVPWAHHRQILTVLGYALIKQGSEAEKLPNKD